MPFDDTRDGSIPPPWGEDPQYPTMERIAVSALRAMGEMTHQHDVSEFKTGMILTSIMTASIIKLSEAALDEGGEDDEVKLMVSCMSKILTLQLRAINTELELWQKKLH